MLPRRARKKFEVPTDGPAPDDDGLVDDCLASIAKIAELSAPKTTAIRPAVSTQIYGSPPFSEQEPALPDPPEPDPPEPVAPAASVQRQRVSAPELTDLPAPPEPPRTQLRAWRFMLAGVVLGIAAWLAVERWRTNGMSAPASFVETSASASFVETSASIHSPPPPEEVRPPPRAMLSVRPASPKVEAKPVRTHVAPARSNAPDPTSRSAVF